MGDRERIRLHLQPLSLLDNAVIAIDEDFRILYTNPAADCMYHLDAAALERPIYELIHFEDPAVDPQTLVAGVLEGNTWTGLTKHTGAGFESLWVEWTLKQVDLPNLARRCVVGIARDVSNRKQAEETLRLRDETLQSIFRAAPTGIGVVVHRVIQRVNQQICDMLGRPAEDLVGQNARILYPSDKDFEYVGAEKYRQISDRGVGTVETRWQRTDGEIIDVLLSSTPIDRDDLAGGVTFTALDITARKRAAREQAVTIEVLELLNRVENEGTIIRDILLVLQNYIGCESVDLRLHDQKDYPTFEEDPALPFYTRGGSFYTGSITELWAARPPQQLPREMHHHCRDQGYESLALVPLRSDAEVIGLLQLADPRKHCFTTETVAFFEQIGASIGIALARAQAYEQRIALEHQLQQSQKMEAMGRLAGGVAHDFNNLLTAIGGYSEIVLNALDETDPLREDVAEIEEAAERATELTGQLLAFSRRQNISPKVIEPNRVIARAEKMLRRIIGEDITLEFMQDMDAGCIEIDPGQLDQILVNLAVNARDAMPRGGRLIIETTRWSAPSTSSASPPLDPNLRTGDFVRLEVRDNGEGIPADILPHIFEPFYSTKETGAGTGLGLATVYGIVSQNKGVIEVWSEPGRGASLSVYFPIINQAPETLDESPAIQIPRGRETILLAEDEVSLRGLAKKILRSYGYHVLEAATGGEASLISRKTDRQIDLLLTDVVMPGMNGRQLYESLLRDRPNIRVLYMSGYTDSTIARHGVLERDAAFLHKPFSQKSLARKVREVLDR